ASAAGRDPGEAHGEAAADAEAAVAPQAAAHELGQAPPGIEADAAPAGGGAVEGVEPLEQAGDVAGEDAGAGVDDGHLEGLAPVGDLDRDGAGGVPQGVVDEGIDDPLQEPAVDRDVELGRAGERQLAVGVPGPPGG